MKGGEHLCEHLGEVIASISEVSYIILRII